MPYTLSHVAAAVPFTRPLVRLHLLSAVIVGSIVPDFGYLMPVHPPRVETHSLIALLTFCLPVGLLAYWVFQYLMKTPLLSVLPDQAYLRWRPHAAPARWNSPRAWLLAAAGILTGSVVHLAWDAFTHEDARGVRMVPELADTMLVVHGHLLTGARLLQGISSLLGVAVVLAGIAYTLRRHGPAERPVRTLTSFERRAWVLVYVASTLTVCVALLIVDPAFGAHRWGGMSSLAIALLRALVPASVGVGLLLSGYLRLKGAAVRA